MKKILPMLLALLLLSACAAADETEMLFRALSMMDRTGGVKDFAVRASIISGAKLREAEGAYSGKLRLRKATYTLSVAEAPEEGGVALTFRAEERAAMWSTIGSIAKAFDKTMTELFGPPVTDVLRLAKGDKPAPRITAGSYNLLKIGDSHSEVYTAWRNRSGTIFASVTGWRSYRKCAFTLTLRFGGLPPAEMGADGGEGGEDEAPEDGAEDGAPEDEDWEDEDEGLEDEDEGLEDEDWEDEDEGLEDEDEGLEDEDWEDESWQEDEDSFLPDEEEFPEEDPDAFEDGLLEIDDGDGGIEGEE